MPRRLRFNRKTPKTAAALAAVLGLMMFIVACFPLLPKEGTGVVGTRPIFSITNIDGINDVVNAVRGHATANLAVRLETDASVKEVVLPHHTLAAVELNDLWSAIRAHSNPSVIVVIGPDHPNKGTAPVQITHGVWTTPFGDVSTDDALVDKLVSMGAASNEPDSFVNEHSIGTHVSYIAEDFPGIPIVPVIAKSTADSTEAEAFERALETVLPEDALIVYSIDFCHYLPEDTTDAMDKETIALVDARDYSAIGRLHSDHLDSPFSLITYLRWSDAHGEQSQLVWHSSSHRLNGQPESPGTSYLVYFSTSFPTSPTSQTSSTFTLTFAGDIMLGRGVADALTKTTVAHAFADAAAAFAGSDIGFANLESVLTTSDNDTGKSIFFKGDPARVDALQTIGVNVVSVANNHIDDYGYAGWQESVQHLRDAGILPVGDFYNQPDVVMKDGVAFLAYEDLYRPVDMDAMKAAIASAAKQSKHVVVSFHWGVEYHHDHTARQTQLAHAAIDDGAELVVGSHPHYLQGVETYHNGLILYSLGNFVFDQIGDDQNETMVAHITWNADGTRTLALTPMRIRGTFPRAATQSERTATLARVKEWSDTVLPDDFDTTGTFAW